MLSLLLTPRRLITFICIVAAGILVGCSPRLNIPDTNDVNRIEIVDQENLNLIFDETGRLRDIGPTKVITDRERIQSALDFASSHNRYWYGEVLVFPSSRYTISFYRDDEFKFVLWFSDGWLGSRNDGEDRRNNRQRLLSRWSTEELKQLLELE